VSTPSAEPATAATPAPPHRTAVAAAVLTAAAVVLTALVAARWGPLVRLDTRVLDDVNRWVAARRGQVGPWKAVSAVLGPTVLRVLAVLVVVLALVRRRVDVAVPVALVFLGGAVLSAGLKVGVGRPRPRPAVVLDTAASQSFPSGHAMTSLLAAGVVVVLLAPRLAGAARVVLLVVAAVVVLAVGASRLALADHFPSDVLGGWLIGGAWLAVSLLLAHRLVPVLASRMGPRGRP
jgi:undecaprenyl-diphosphatase